MSSLLRSTKFVRYFTGAARTLILNSAKSVETNLLINSKSLWAVNSILVRDYATSKKSESLEPLLLRLDSEVRRFGRITKRDIDEVFEGIRSRNDITSSQSLLVIRCCGELVPEELPEQRTLLVQKIWSVLTERGVPMDISHYNALLRVYIENEHKFSPAEFLDELEKKGVQPNRVTYQRLMWRYCMDGDVEGATKVLEKMRELSMPVSEPVLNALVMGHAFHGDTEGSRAVLDTMAVAGLQPTNRTYALLACGYGKIGDVQGIEDVIKITTEKEIYMTDKDYLDIIEALATSGHSDKVDKFLDRAPKSVGYNQDARNTILHLINKGHEETAKKILKTMTKSNRFDAKEDMNYQGAFFVKQLMRVNNSSESILKTCKELQEEGLVPHAIYIATEFSLQQGHVELAQELFNELHKQGFEIRQHYYWPLLTAKAKENDEEGLLQILRNMSNIGLMASGETLRDYVLPFLCQNNSPQNTITKLQVANVPTIHCARNLMIQLLESSNLKAAADIAIQFKPRGQFSLIARPLISAVDKTKDINSFVTILQVACSKPTFLQTDNGTSLDEVQNQTDDREEVGRIVKNAVKTLSKPQLCDELFLLLINKGITISMESVESIEQYLGENMTAGISEKLSKLTSAMELSPIQTSTTPRTVPQLEFSMNQAKSRGDPVTGLQRQLLTGYIKDNNIDQVDKLILDMEKEDFVFTENVLAQLVEFYSLNDNVNKALHYVEMLTEKFPEFKLNKFKIVQLAFALIRADRVNEAIDILENNKQESVENVSFLFNSLCWRSLNYLAEKKDTAMVEKLTKLFIENKFTEPTNVLLGPIIKVHLLNDNLDAALKEFEYCCNQYRCTPWKGEIMKRLIMAEDATRLQSLADLSTQIHGEVNTLHDLVLAFVECGRLRQARRILETPGLQARHGRLEDACERYVEEGKTEYLEGLLEATKELSHIDRSNIFFHLLVSYCKADETDKALGLWTLLQEEDEVPSDKFLLYLGKHLKSKNREVPFAIPEEKKQVIDTEPKGQKVAMEEQEQKIKKNDFTELIEDLVRKGMLDEAMFTLNKAIKQGSLPRANVIKFLLQNLANEGEVEKIMSLENYFTEQFKRKVAFTDKMTRAKFVQGSGYKHLDELDKFMETAETNDQFEEAAKIFPRGTALATAIQEKDMFTKCHRIAVKLASVGQIIPVNIMWMEYLLAGFQKEADSLWNDFLVNADMIMYRRLVQEAHVKKEPQLIEKLITYLQSNPKVTKEAIGNAYSRLINFYLTENNVEKADEVFKKALSEGLGQDKLNRTTVRNLEKKSGRVSF